MYTDWGQGGQVERASSRPSRSRAERKRHVLRMLESENKLRIATASEDGSAHLVPLSFVWDGERIVAATNVQSPVARNAQRTGKARVALGTFGDVVLIDLHATVTSHEAIDGNVAERLVRVSALDGRSSSSVAYLHLTPWRVQAWWSLQEPVRPTIMPSGRWLA
jgi:general stress protein 26